MRRVIKKHERVHKNNRNQLRDGLSKVIQKKHKYHQLAKILGFSAPRVFDGTQMFLKDI